MNARLYDAKLHRFLAPDNFVQDQYNTQNYNRYSYVLNNPLSFVDPSGEFAWIPVIMAAVMGAFIESSNTYNAGGSWFTGAFVGGSVGFLTSVVSAGAGGFFSSIFGTSIAGSIASSVVTGAIIGGVGSAISGGDFWNGVGTGALISGAYAGISAAYMYHSSKMLNFSDMSSNSDGTLKPGQENLDKMDERFSEFKYQNKSRSIYKNDIGQPAGYTDKSMTNGKYNSYYNNKAFKSPKYLFMVMGHEKFHIALAINKLEQHWVKIGRNSANVMIRNDVFAEYAADEWSNKILPRDYKHWINHHYRNSIGKQNLGLWRSYQNTQAYQKLMLRFKYTYTDHGKYWGLPLKY